MTLSLSCHPPDTWENTPVTILGMSQTGMSAVDYLVAHGAHCFLSEMLPGTPANKTQRERLSALGVPFETGGHTAQCFEHSPWVIVSPGIPQHAPVLTELAMSGKCVMSDVELAYWEATRRNLPLVAITGTNGKTTTTLLVSAILSASGLKAPVCGNIGMPILSQLEGSPDVLVAELSSAQIAMTHRLKPTMAILTNFRPDHLDWHGSLEAYKQAKFKLFTGEQAPEWSILNAADETCRELAAITPSKVCLFSREPVTQPCDAAIWLDASGHIVFKPSSKASPQTLFAISSASLPGRHNQENILAAMALALLYGVEPAVIEGALTVFKGAAHRLELLDVGLDAAHGVRYYNDSKATNVDAVVCALEAFAPGEVVLIAGGRDKMTPLEEFVSAVKTHVHRVVLIGEAADRFELMLREAGYSAIERANTLDAAVVMATRIALEEPLASAPRPVVFSPACSSFDMFKNYEERGDAFKTIVQSLVLAPGEACRGPISV
jgi:UDP-N-acetylmuramoylalanine--D-glutamate ligase